MSRLVFPVVLQNKGKHSRELASTEFIKFLKYAMESELVNKTMQSVYQICQKEIHLQKASISTETCDHF